MLVIQATSSAQIAELEASKQRLEGQVAELQMKLTASNVSVTAGTLHPISPHSLIRSLCVAAGLMSWPQNEVESLRRTAQSDKETLSATEVRRVCMCAPVTRSP